MLQVLLYFTIPISQWVKVDVQFRSELITTNHQMAF